MKHILHLFVLVFAATFVPQTAMGADYYGIKVGGVSVNSDNYSNVTGSNIKAKDTSKSFYVRYTPSTKTLTVCNVKIERTGSGNRAILNESCSGLTIVFIGSNMLKAEDASPVRLNANTTITSGDDIADRLFTNIQGGDEDALTVASGASLTIKDAKISLYATKSTGLYGYGKENVTIINSNFQSIGYETGLRSIASLTVSGSIIEFNCTQSSGKAATELGAFTLGSDMIFRFGESFSAVSRSFLKNGSVCQSVKMETFIPINSTTFPDTNLRNFVKNKYDTNSDSKLGASEAEDPKVIDASNISASNFTGLKYFPNLVELNCSGNPIKSVTLNLPNLIKLNCSSCQLSSMNLTGCSSLENLDCSKNSLSIINFKNTPAIKYVDMRNNWIDSNMSSTLNSLPGRDYTDRGEIYINGGVNTMPDNICDSWTASSVSYFGWNYHIAPCDEYTGAQLLNVRIGENEVTSYDKKDLSYLSSVKKNTTNGYINYDAISQTLNLSGVDITAPEGECGIKFYNMGRVCNIVLGPDPVNIITTSKNGIETSFDAAITVNGDVYIESGNANAIFLYKGGILGTGSLDCKGRVNGIYTSYGLSISGSPKVKAEGTIQYGIRGNTDIHGEGTLVMMKGAQSAFKGSQLVLNDGLYIGYPFKAYLKDYNSGIVDANGQTIKDDWVIISKYSQTIIDGIDDIKDSNDLKDSKDSTYNLAGQKVGSGYKGIIIKDGKKILKR